MRLPLYKSYVWCLLAAAAIAAQGADAIRVSPGDSLAAAVAKARATGAKEIRLAGGIHPCRETLKLDRRDDGLAFVAAEGETPVLDGGIALTGGVRTPDGLVEYDLVKLGYAAAKAPLIPFGTGMGDELNPIEHPMLSRGGKLLDEASEPGSGWVNVTEVIDRTNFIFRAEVRGMEKLVGRKGLFAYGSWTFGWSSQMLAVEVLKDAKGVYFRLENPGGLPDYMVREGIVKGQNFRLLGTREFLDADGEWFFDRLNGRAYVRAGGSDEVRLAAFEGPFIDVDGTRGLAFRGVTFANGSCVGLAATNTIDLLMDRCTVENFGGCGARIEGAFGTRVTHCTFRGFGAFGLRLVGGDRKRLRDGDNLVEDCEFTDGSRIERNCTHLIRGHGIGNRYVHCHFHDTPAAAVRFDGNEMVFASNVVERCVTETDDWGAVENYGSPYFRGSRIFHNVFRDNGNGLPWNVCGQCAVRFDDMVGHMLVYGNRFINSSFGHFGAVQSNGGTENVVEHNLFIGGEAMFSVNSWSRALADGRERTLPSRDPVDVTSAEWRGRYGDVNRSENEVRRHHLRHNVMVGGRAPVFFWGPGRCELVSEFNQFLPAGTPLGGGSAAAKRVIRCSNNNYEYCIISNLTVTGGYLDAAENGGGIAGSLVRAYDCIISNNFARGGWYGGGGGMTGTYAENCLFENNSTNDGGGQHGGGFNCSGYRALAFGLTSGARNCVFRNNRAPNGMGGGCYAAAYNDSRHLEGGSTPIIGCTFEGNQCGWYGGAGLRANGRVVDCHFVTNKWVGWSSAGLGGGGATVSAFGSYAYVTNCTFTGNDAGSGSGGGLNTEGNVPVYDCTLEDNYAYFMGGGLYCTGGLVTNCVFRRNSSHDIAGGIYLASDDANATFRCVDCTIEGNRVAGGNGGGAMAPGGFVGCTFITNSCSGAGGAIYANGASACGSISNCVIRGNKANNSSCAVGTSAAANGTTVFGCEVYGNVNGGQSVAEDITFRNSVVSNHHVTSWCFRRCNFYTCLVADNRSSYGSGGVSVDSIGGGSALAYTNANCVFKDNFQYINAITEAKVIVNCLYIGNQNNSGAYGDIVREGAMVYNTVFLDNLYNTALRDFRTGSYPTMQNCTYSHISDAALPGKCTGCFAATREQLRLSKDPATPYAPRVRSPLKNAAYDVAWIREILGETDFYGAPRLVGNRLDIGPAEFHPSDFGLFFFIR